jgi:hypothetical protein
MHFSSDLRRVKVETWAALHRRIVSEWKGPGDGKAVYRLTGNHEQLDELALLYAR